MKTQATANKHIDDFIKSYLQDDAEFAQLTDVDQVYVFSVLKKLLGLIQMVLKNDDVYPILFVNCTKTKHLIEKAFMNLFPLIPQVINIKVIVMH